MSRTMYAAHYVHHPERGFLKSHAVEVVDGCAVRVFPLEGERAGTEWHPGVIVLQREGDTLIPYIYYPFDFTQMRPVAGTRRRRLP